MEELDLKELCNIFWRKKVQIIFIILVSLLVGIVYIANSKKEPIYSATTTIIVATTKTEQEEEKLKTVVATQAETLINSKLANNYSELIKSKSVLEQVILNLKIDLKESDLENSIEVNQIEETELIEITAKNNNSENAVKIANETAKVFIEKVKKIYNLDNVKIVDSAEQAITILSANPVKEIIKFILTGIVISIAYVLLIIVLDDTIKTKKEIEKEFDLPVLISIPKCKTKSKKQELEFSISELFRILRTNIQFLNKVNQTQTVLVTSAMPKEGKSLICANLVKAFVQANKKVILIDADMRKGRQHSIFGQPQQLGLSNYLMEFNKNKDELKKYIKNIHGLDLMTSGSIPENPSELLDSKEMSELIDKLKDIYDIIIIDGTSGNIVTDTLILSKIVETNIIVVESNKTKREDLHTLINNIKNIGGNIAGVILNKTTLLQRKNIRNYYKTNEVKEEKKQK